MLMVTSMRLYETTEIVRTVLIPRVLKLYISLISVLLPFLCSVYQPGLWQAVVNDDLLAVRRLVNLWCRVDISKVVTALFNLQNA